MFWIMAFRLIEVFLFLFQAWVPDFFFNQDIQYKQISSLQDNNFHKADMSKQLADMMPYTLSAIHPDCLSCRFINNKKFLL